MTDLRTAAWRISSHSDSQGSCVEVAPLDGGDVAVRHSHHPDGAVMVCAGPAWAVFTAGIRAGDFEG